MTLFTPKIYQQQVLDSIEAYFKTCHELPSPSLAFTATTERLWEIGNPYRPLSGFPADMPYFCLRVPTGGGKTWLAAKSVARVNTHLLRCEHSVILWLVPSKPIREQTIKALKDRSHPYHAALREAGPITVLDLEEAKSVTRSTLESSTTVIVATRQAFQVEEEECRKVYQSSGALMHHFDNLSPVQRDGLLSEGEGVNRSTPYSLANVLRLRRPFVIVDEAHNSRTELAFDMLARFRPSGVMELTATPDLERTPSNVLHSVSAAELKAEEMIKLPVVLQTEPNWQQCLADAIGRRDALHTLAKEERRAGAAYLRPIVLIQSEPRRAGIETLDFEKVKNELITHHGIPASEIVVATGEEKGLERIDAEYPLGLSDPACPVKFVITQKALAEGWDCPFAYILVSMASLSSATAVEQLLGRVLRQPGASHRRAQALNQSYAFVVSRNFAETAGALHDRLVAGAGFERRDVAEFVTAAKTEQARLDLEGSRAIFTPVAIRLPEKPDLKSVPKPVRDKLIWDSKRNSLTISRPLTEEETAVLKAAVTSETAAAAIVEAAEVSRTTAIEFFQTPAELGERFRVPQLALRVQGELQLLDDPEVLEYPWALSPYDAVPTADDLSTLGAALKVTEGGEIDIDAGGHVVSRFLPDLQRDLGLVYQPENWDEVRIATWLCRNLPEPSLTHASKQAFVAAWITDLLRQEGFTLARANLQKFLIRNLLEARIRELRKQAVGKAFQQALFGDDAATRVAVTDQYAFEFHAQAYAPSRDYDGRTSTYGHFDFRKHFYGRIGDFDSKEEFECACQLDIWAQQGRLQFWVRNLVRREGCSFFLQKADGRFYPDFLCQLPGATGQPGPVLAVEYKGADRWNGAEDDRLIGGLWARLSEDRCRFVMVKNKRWDWIEEKL
jgi:type III restriction enzyme